MCVVTLSCFELETRNWKQSRAEGCPEQWIQMNIYCKPGCDSLFQLWQPTTWSGRHLACSVHLLKSPWLGPTRVTRRGSSQPSQRATTGLQNTMKPFICKCEKYPGHLVWQVQMQRTVRVFQCPQTACSGPGRVHEPVAWSCLWCLCRKAGLWKFLLQVGCWGLFYTSSILRLLSEILCVLWTYFTMLCHFNELCGFYW